MCTGEALNARVGTANRIVTVTPAFRRTVVGTMENTRVSRSALGSGRFTRLSGTSICSELDIYSSEEVFYMCRTLGENVAMRRVRGVALVSR